MACYFILERKGDGADFFDRGYYLIHSTFILNSIEIPKPDIVLYKTSHKGWEG